MTLLILVIVLSVVALAWAVLSRETYIELSDEEYTPRKVRSDKGKKRGQYNKQAK